MAGTICWLLITQGGNTWICTIGGDWTKPNSFFFFFLGRGGGSQFTQSEKSNEIFTALIYAFWFVTSKIQF